MNFVNIIRTQEHVGCAVAATQKTDVTMTSKVNRKMEILTPVVCRAETPKNIEPKIRSNDYVIDPYRTGKI